MNLISKEVMHKHFGKGNIVELSDSCIEVQFPSGSKRFVFPDAFGTFLTMLDKKAADSLKKNEGRKRRGT